MPIKPRAKSTTKTVANAEKPVNLKTPITEVRSTVVFRTRQVTKKKAEKIFGDMGISMSAALNMFLNQVVRDKGLPFIPTTQRKEAPGRTKGATSAADLTVFEDLWEDI